MIAKALCAIPSATKGKDTDSKQGPSLKFWVGLNLGDTTQTPTTSGGTWGTGRSPHVQGRRLPWPQVRCRDMSGAGWPCRGKAPLPQVQHTSQSCQAHGTERCQKGKILCMVTWQGQGQPTLLHKAEWRRGTGQVWRGLCTMTCKVAFGAPTKSGLARPAPGTQAHAKAGSPVCPVPDHKARKRICPWQGLSSTRAPSTGSD